MYSLLGSIGGRLGRTVNDLLGGGDNSSNKSSVCCVDLMVSLLSLTTLLTNVSVLLIRFDATLCPLLQSTTISSPMPPVCLILLADAGIISEETNIAVSDETGRGVLL